MPRKRTTRAQNTRATPKLKHLEDELVNGMSVEERKSKLDGLIKDFDYNVENVCRQYEEEREILLKEIEKHFYHIRCQLSPMELQMTVEQYLDFTLSEDAEKEDTVTMPLSTTSHITSSLQNSKNALSRYRSKQTIETIPEEGGTGVPQTNSKRGRKKPVGNKGQGVSFIAPQPLSAVHNSYITPASQRNIATTGWGATPLVTPKFDPRLPITPANSRRLKPGEVVMSLAGSPVNAENNSRSRTLVLNNGEEIDIEIPDRANIDSLMSTLRDIMKKGQDAQS
ncbi:borealin-like [Ruditapes philippinarum]|uniref:borealin-like n=1 Tax=Ruditapes philippinarum TaxID=129788 RepID=UPI00295C315E|nr:borealin-like [Ruditapes philippinarum]